MSGKMAGQPVAEKLPDKQPSSTGPDSADYRRTPTPNTTLPDNGNNTVTTSNSSISVSPQKLGSYRAKAGKISNKFGSFFPSIGTKLHMSKKGTMINEKSLDSLDDEFANLAVGSSPVPTSPSPEMTMGIANDGKVRVTASSISSAASLNMSSLEPEGLIQFPSYTSSSGIPNLELLRTSADSFSGSTNASAGTSAGLNANASSNVKATILRDGSDEDGNGTGAGAGAGSRAIGKSGALNRFPSLSVSSGTTPRNTLVSQINALSLNPYNSTITGSIWPSGSGGGNGPGTNTNLKMQPQYFAGVGTPNSDTGIGTAPMKGVPIIGTSATDNTTLSPNLFLESGRVSPSRSNEYANHSLNYFSIPLSKTPSNYEPGTQTNIDLSKVNTTSTSTTATTNIWSPQAVSRRRSQSLATHIRTSSFGSQKIPDLQPRPGSSQKFGDTPPVNPPLLPVGVPHSHNLRQYHGQQQPQQQQQEQQQQQWQKMFAAGPILMDDVDPRYVSWVSPNPSVPLINQTNSLLPTNALAFTNIYSLQQYQPRFINAINLTSAALASLCSIFGRVVSARTLGHLHIALVEFETVEQATKAMEALQDKDISLVGYPTRISYAKILPIYTPDISKHNSPLSLMEQQLFNGSLTFQQRGAIQLPLLTSLLQNPINVSGDESLSQQSQQQQLPHPSQQHVDLGGNSRAQLYQQPIMLPVLSTTDTNSKTTQVTLPVEQEKCPFPLPPPNLQAVKSMMIKTISSFKVDFDQDEIKYIVSNARKSDKTIDMANFGPVPDPLAAREFQTPKLREIRKAIDSDSLSTIEIEQIGIAMLDELPELSFDYLGNNIVQKIYDRSSDIVKDIILRKVSKFLTGLGIHKSGTWVCQKIIKLASNPRAKALVTDGIKDYCTPLFNDQFGNYVIQEVLKFGTPWNNFIFESILSNFWLICQNKYGARAVRSCLEANDIITTEQTLLLSSMIILYAEYLITDTNGTLLITWLLDTCELSKKYSILTNKIVGNITTLCCHKLGSLTVLKILNSRSNEDCRKRILDVIFGENEQDPRDRDNNLRVILTDTGYGPTFMYKLLTSRLLEEQTKNSIVERVRQILLKSNSGQQNHKLMEEVGLVSINNNVPDRSPLKTSRTPTHMLFVSPDNPRRMRGMSASSVRSAGMPAVTIPPVSSTGNSALLPATALNYNGGHPVPLPGSNVSPSKGSYETRDTSTLQQQMFGL